MPPAHDPPELDDEYVPGFEKLEIKSDGLYRRTRSKMAIPFDYSQIQPTTKIIYPESENTSESVHYDYELGSTYASSNTEISIWSRVVTINITEGGNREGRSEANVILNKNVMLPPNNGKSQMPNQDSASSSGTTSTLTLEDLSWKFWVQEQAYQAQQNTLNDLQNSIQQLLALR